MNIKIIFPKQYFTEAQLARLTRGTDPSAPNTLEFIAGSNLDLDAMPSLFAPEPYYLAVNPTYLKDNWEAFPVERLERMTGLKALCLTTSSYSWVDGKFLAAKKGNNGGVVLTNIPGAPARAVAEFNIFMMFSLLRKLPLIIKNNWEMDYDRFINSEAHGLTAGILGLGNIGSRTAELCEGLGLKVQYWNRSPKQSGYRSVSIEELLATSDVIFNTLATPPETGGLITPALLQTMKPTALIVSSSDLKIFDKDLVLKKVLDGTLGGLAFESKTEKTADFKGNVMVFPEQAYYTEGTQRKRAEVLTETLVGLLEGKVINRVN